MTLNSTFVFYTSYHKAIYIPSSLILSLLLAMPTIIKHPVSMVFSKNSEQVCTLSCLANGLEPLNYLWQMYQSTNDSWTEPSVRAVNITSPKLVFSKPTEEDEGIYRCIVFSEDDHVASNNATITLYGESQFCNN